MKGFKSVGIENLQEVHQRCLQEQLDSANPSWVDEAKRTINNDTMVESLIYSSVEEAQDAAIKENEMMNYLRSVFTSPLGVTIQTSSKPWANNSSSDNLNYGDHESHESSHVSSIHRDSCPPSPLTTSSTSTLSPSTSPTQNSGFMTARSAESASSTWKVPSREVIMTYQVQFAHYHQHCRLHSSLPPNFIVKRGQFVIIQGVEKDGYHLGVVTDVYNPAQYRQKMRSLSKSRDADENKIGIIQRIALPSERQYLTLKTQKETEITKNVLYLIHHVFKLSMELKGVELQFDLRKLTVLYHSDSRVDFRELVRDLNLLYRVRIFMKKTNFCRPFEPVPEAAVALRTGCDMLCNSSSSNSGGVGVAGGHSSQMQHYCIQ